MNKKILAIVAGGVLVASGVLLVAFGNTGLFQGRFALFKGNKLSYAMDGLCITPEQYFEKYIKPNQNQDSGASSGEGENTDGNGRSGDTVDSSTPRRSGSTTGEETSKKEGEETKETPAIDPGTISIGNIGGSGSGGVLENSSQEEEGGEEGEDPGLGEDGSEDKPFTKFEECNCGDEGKILEQYTDEEGKYWVKMCIAPSFWKCVRPKYKCPDGTEPDWPKLHEKCKKNKVKSCYSAAKPDQEVTGMCNALADWVNDLKCVPETECQKYLGMSEKEYEKWVDSLGLPEEYFGKGGAYDEYKPKNNKEKKAIKELKKSEDCFNLYT